jgi:hypothetical protein
MMEEKIFPRPAVAEALKENFIEARLHNDGGPRMNENRELQKKLTGSVATPIYVIIDPKTGQKLRTRAGAMSQVKFIEFLRGKALE